MELSDWIAILIWIGIFLFSVILHELGHGIAAYWLGDSTAKRAGRLTLNPLKHLDWTGTLIMPAAIWILSQGRFIFGMAKPVPVDFLALRNPRRDMVLVAAAGPGVNLLLAWFFSTLYGQTGSSLFVLAAYLNIALAAFNLMPIPPLDGSKVAAGLLPARVASWIFRFETFGFAVILILYFTGVFQALVYPVMNMFARGFKLPGLNQVLES